MIGGWRTPEPDQSHFYFMMTIKDGKFYKDGVHVPTEHGNKEQIAKKYIKTKRMRRLLKQSRMEEVKRLKIYGLWNSRNIELKLCSECDFLNCTCIRNQCANKLIKLYSNCGN